MTQRSFFWNGSTVGDADTYTKGKGYHTSVSTYESSLHDRLLRATWNGTENRGVLPDWNNELAVTSGAGSISVNTGAAIVYGLYYENTTPTNKTITTPTTASRRDRVVVRRNWATQEARIHVITGVEGDADSPALVQSPKPSGSGVYDIPLATATVTTGGGITISDEREYCTPSTTMTSTSNLFTTASFADDSITFSQRASRSKVFFLGGGDFVADVIPGQWTRAYYDGGEYVVQSPLIDNHVLTTQTGPPVFDGAANIKAWESDVTSYGGIYASLCLPGDLVDGTTITSYIWIINNVTTTTAATIYSSYHVRGNQPMFASGRASYSFSASTANKVYRIAGVTMYGASASYWAGNGLPLELSRDRMFHYRVWTTGISGSESIGIMGIEFRYTGYT